MKELVVISGKGGTGKTSLTASLAILAGKVVVADCDVDAADLHLVLSPEITKKEDFYSGKIASIDGNKCTECGLCKEYCRFGAVENNKQGAFEVDPIECEGCGVCVKFCPVGAIDFEDRLCGEWMISQTRAGSMVHAKLGVAAENSGKLVSTVRQKAKEIAVESGIPLVIVDGPPGIGCPVIASITGATLVLVVTEPTVSGVHDLERVLKLAKHFDIPTAVCVNKYDINIEMTERIEVVAKESGATIAGRIRYDDGVTNAQVDGKAVVETFSSSSKDIHEIWKLVKNCLEG